MQLAIKYKRIALNEGHNDLSSIYVQTHEAYYYINLLPLPIPLI